jgi:hypothetical protein
MSKATKVITPTNSALVPLTPEQALAEIPQLFDLVPDVTEDPTPRMAAAILNADDPEDWEAIFSGKSIKDSVGAKVRVVAIRKSASDFEGPIKQFLIAETVNVETGESDVMTISSVMSMLQLLVANQRGWLPLDVEVVRKKKATKRGFFPIHLKALAPAKQVSQAS